MKLKDQKMLEEAYISASQKSINIPTDLEVAPVADEPVVVSITSDEPVADTDHSCGCEGETVDHHEEEHEESSMAKANLYSIYTDAKTLHDLIEGGVHLETWMLQKIAVVADKLAGVAKVAEYHAAKREEHN